jgi:hypothetical protein
MSLTAGNLFISSYNNQDNESSTNFSIVLSVPVTKARRVRLLGATVPHLMMPFGTNDRLFAFRLNGVNYNFNFDITRRWATMTDFLTYINAEFLTLGMPSVLTWSYDANVNKLTVTSANPADTITIYKWDWNNPTGSNVSLNANYRLGFTNTSDLTTTGSATADGFPNVFIRTNIIYITTNIVADSNNDANIPNVLGRIPVDVNWGGLVVYENVHSDFVSPVFSENIKDIAIRLLDEDYQPLVLPNNAYFNLVIGIEY